MADPIAQIQKLGWEWRDDGMGMGLPPGVCITVVVNGRPLRAFVPLTRVWLAFDQELQKVGCVGACWVGAPFSCGGFFSSIAHAVSSAAKAVSKAVPNVVKKAASTVVNTAKTYASKALSAVNKIPVLGTVTHAAESLALLPAQAAKQLVQGKRIDQIALGQFKSALGSIKEVAPLAQTVISFVPGIGTGISAGIGAATALAQGHSITDALLAAAKSAIPGGPAAQAAFSIASDAMQGKPLSTIALDAVPGLSPQAKTELLVGLNAAKQLTEGKPVAQVFVDNAIRALPPAYQRAVQVGVALGHAKNLQGAVSSAVQGAAQLASTAANGSAAAKAFAQGVRTPAVLAAMNAARTAQHATASIVQAAQQGHQQAQHIVNALQMFKKPAAIAPPAPRPALPAPFANLFHFA